MNSPKIQRHSPRVLRTCKLGQYFNILFSNYGNEKFNALKCCMSHEHCSGETSTADPIHHIFFPQEIFGNSVIFVIVVYVYALNT